MLTKLLAVLAVALTSLTSVQAVPATPQKALKLIPTSQWCPVNATNPNHIELRGYEPAIIKKNPAIILALHWCGSSGPDYFAYSTYAQYADERGFIVLFNAMSCYSGVAAGCLAGSPGSSPTTADPTCVNGQIIKTPAQWKAVAQAMYPGYNGPYPRIQTFHGEVDDLVFPTNLGEQLKQWSAIHSVSLSQTKLNTPYPGWTYLKYGNGKQLVRYSVANVGHFVIAEEEMDLSWFGL